MNHYTLRCSNTLFFTPVGGVNHNRAYINSYPEALSALISFSVTSLVLGSAMEIYTFPIGESVYAKLS